MTGAAPRRRAQRVPVGALGGGNGRHGLSPGMIEAMRARQGDRCPICLAGLPRVPAVDHDHEQAVRDGHEAGRGCRRCVRALLCPSCNSVLGFAGDSVVILERAIGYLATWRARR